ncbi:MAG: hypothetical protein U0892_01575 [Pirellulales bacterium]
MRDLLTATGSPEINPPAAWYREVNNIESRSEDIAQLFLGQRMQALVVTIIRLRSGARTITTTSPLSSR